MNSLSTRRLATALFFMAFGYALLSVCLFRILAFSASSTAFFVMYVGVGMPIGACVAQRLRANRERALSFSIKALWVALLVVPLTGWLATLGVSPLLSESNVFLLNEFDVSFFWRRLAYQCLVASPFFILWGYGEFVGYEMAMRSASRPLRMGFYILFVWALLCAVIVGFWTIPIWGWARTLALAAFASVIAHQSLVEPKKSLYRYLPYGLAALVWFVAGATESQYIRHLYPQPGTGVGVDIRTKARPFSVLASMWGPYSHVSLLQEGEGNGIRISGAYDGVTHWTVQPSGENGNDQVAAVFDAVGEGADIAVLGAGGGRQVKLALNRKPHSVVAVDVVPEVFTLLKDDKYAWANGFAYQSPLVETVAADGRNYLLNTTRQFDLIVLPNTESFAAVVRALFEPGQRIHTVEAFEVMRHRLKPNGLLAIVKTMDSNERLFNGYAAALRQVGLYTEGWIHPTKGFPGQPLVLLASPTRAALNVDAKTRDYFDENGFTFVDFQEKAPRGEPIYDDSPWILGVLGSFIPAEKLRVMFLGIVAVACAGVVVVIALSSRRRDVPTSLARQAVFVLAGVGVGIHAVYLQNGVIFWFLYHLFNPLAAFFIGTAFFLLMWGLSSMLLRNWAWLLIVSGIGIVGLLLSGGWQSYGSLASMACLALGSGFCFPLLGLRFQTRLLDLFVADAIGGFSGGILGIWLPLSFGLERFFHLMPWVSGSTLAMVVLCVLVSQHEPDSLPSVGRLVQEA